jgi:hypothetical protein
MDITIQSPALLFPAITLLLLAYTSRFIALINIIRGLRQDYINSPGDKILKEIKFLRHRVIMIRSMQLCAILSFFLCTVSMFFFYLQKNQIAEIVFAGSLLLMMTSLVFSFRDTLLSVKSLDIHLSDIEEELKK